MTADRAPVVVNHDTDPGVDLATGREKIDESDVEASDRLVEPEAERRIWRRRVGSPHAYHCGRVEFL